MVENEVEPRTSCKLSLTSPLMREENIDTAAAAGNVSHTCCQRDSMAPTPPSPIKLDHYYLFNSSQLE